MGTRADFYVGRGKDSEWLGSIAWDGYPEGIDREVLISCKEKGYRKAVKAFIDSKRSDGSDGIYPYEGWPWPWDDSQTTDYAYAFDGTKVHASIFGSKWHDPLIELTDEKYEDIRGKHVDFPDMSERKNVKDAGFIVVSM